MTSQVERDIADVNNIIAHFARTGSLPQYAVRNTEPQYADVSEISNMDRAELLRKQNELNEKITLENERLNALQIAAETSKHVELGSTPAVPDQLLPQDSDSAE